MKAMILAVGRRDTVSLAQRVWVRDPTRDRPHAGGLRVNPGYGC